MSKSLYGQYIFETKNKEIVESQKGFATYFHVADGLYIEEIFFHPDYRKTGEASALADQIADVAREKGLKRLYGSVAPSANNSTASLHVLLSYGFKLHEAGPNAVILVKEVAI
jgi:GNAT superfamily N-acetyltransferase